jgi:hypothetical protein
MSDSVQPSSSLDFVSAILNFVRIFIFVIDHLYGPVVRVPGYRSRGPGSISGATRFSEKQWVWNEVHSTS